MNRHLPRIAAIGFASAVLVGGCSPPSGDSSSVTQAPEVGESVLQFRPVLSLTAVTSTKPCPPVEENPSPQQGTTACSKDQATIYGLGPAFETNANIVDVSVATPPLGGTQVNIEFDEAGRRSMADASKRMVSYPPPKNQFAILLDGIVFSAPFFQEPILGGVASLTGFDDDAEAREVADSITPKPQ
ncbi:MAG: hypothetical protein WC054_09745 [Candidatus Nanopelagicales bacterium]